MRIFLNILAVIGGLYSGLMVIAGGAFLVMGIWSLYHEPQAPRFAVSMFIAIGAGSAFLGMLMIVRAWRHLRRPDRNTANDVFCIATVVVVMSVMDSLRKNSILPVPGAHVRFEPLMDLGVFVGLIIVSYLFYRLVLKRLAARAFPPEATSSPT